MFWSESNCFFLENLFANIVCIQNVSDQKFLLELTLSDPKFCWTQNFFDPQFSGQMVFRTIFILNIIFYPQFFVSFYPFGNLNLSFYILWIWNISTHKFFELPFLPSANKVSTGPTCQKVCVCLSVFPVFFSRRLIGWYSGFWQ